MGIEVQSRTCQPSQTIEFTFQEPLQDRSVGLGCFKLTYGLDADHWVETLSISLQPTMAAPPRRYAYTTDNHNRDQDDALSHVNVLVASVPVSPTAGPS